MKKGVLLVTLLLGVITMEGKPQYRIKVWNQGEIIYYQPERRMNRLRAWESYRNPFQYKSIAEGIIDDWKKGYEIKHNKKVYQYVDR